MHSFVLSLFFPFFFSFFFSESFSLLPSHQMNRVNLPIHPFILCLCASAARAGDFFTWVTINCFNTHKHTREETKKESSLLCLVCFRMLGKFAAAWVNFFCLFHRSFLPHHKRHLWGTRRSRQRKIWNVCVLSSATHWHPRQQWNVTWEWLSLFVIYFLTQTHVTGKSDAVQHDHCPVTCCLVHERGWERWKDHSTSRASKNRYRKSERGQKMTLYITSHHITSHRITSTQVNVVTDVSELSTSELSKRFTKQMGS